MNTDTPPTTNHTVADIRQWLKANGFVVGARGAIPAHLNKVYAEAHGLD